MTDKKQPEALRLADALERPGYGWHSTPAQCAAELRRQYAELETLRAGYDAARLEIESLKAQSADAMHGEHAELRRLSDCCPELNLSNYGPDDVGELNGWAIEVSQCIDRALAAQPAGAQQPATAYAALMQAASDWICENVPTGTRGATAWATKLQNVANALRASHGQAPAQPVATAGGSLARIIEEKIAAMSPSEASAFMAARAELAASGNDQAAPDMRDPYGGAREDLAIWRKRALEAEALNRKFATSVNGPTFMGEPADSDGALMAREIHESQEDSLLICASDLQHSAIYDNHVEMQSCMRAVAARIAALVHAATKAEPAAPAAVARPSEAVAYLDIGAGGYLDLGTDLTDEAVSRLPKGRHALVIAGTYGIDGYIAAPTTQPAPQQEAPAMPSGWVSCTIEFDGSGPEEVAYGPKITMDRLAKWLGKHFERTIAEKAAPQPSPVAQDAARLDWLENDVGCRVFHLGKSWYTRANFGMPYRKRASLREAIDAARAAQEWK